MPWFKVDDGFAFHPKTVRAGNLAIGLWVRAGAWSSQHLTEGFIPADIVTVLGGRTRDAQRLVDSELWTTAEGGYRFHQWDERQPAKEQVEADRESARERQRRARERAKSQRESRDSHAVTHGGVTVPLVTVPPTRPDPTSSSSGTTEGPRKRATRIPDSFAVDDDMRSWADDKGYHPLFVSQQTERFVNYWQAKSGKDATKVDWPATWRNWLLKGADDHRPVSGNADDHHTRYMARLAHQEAQ